MHHSHKTDQEAKQTTQAKACPEDEGREFIGVEGEFVHFKGQNEGQEEEDGIHVVVEQKLGLIVVYKGENLLGVGCVQRDEERRENPRNGADQGKVDFSIYPHIEPTNDNQQSKHNMLAYTLYIKVSL